jgi:hypothetical protein
MYKWPTQVLGSTNEAYRRRLAIAQAVEMPSTFSKRGPVWPVCAGISLLDFDLHSERLDASDPLRGMVGALLMRINVHFSDERHRSIGSYSVDLFCLGAQLTLQFIGNVF